MFYSKISKKYCVLLALSLSILFGNLLTSAFAVETGNSATALTQGATLDKSIGQLTHEQDVVLYLQQYKRLPDFYVTKQQAIAQGWDSHEGNLCQAVPGHAIGGDIFSNRGKQLPDKAGRVWHEADINYDCGYRGVERVLYSDDGLIYVTHDHYKSFVLAE